MKEDRDIGVKIMIAILSISAILMIIMGITTATIDGRRLQQCKESIEENTFEVRLVDHTIFDEETICCYKILKGDELKEKCKVVRW